MSIFRNSKKLVRKKSVHNVVGFLSLGLVLFTYMARANFIKLGETEKQKILKNHNVFRQNYNIDVDLEWSDELQKYAESRVAGLSGNCRIHHNGLKRGIGENLYMSGWKSNSVHGIIGGLNSWKKEVGGWTKERILQLQNSGGTLSIGHATQMLSKRSVSVGCAMGVYSCGSVLSCNYEPAGNMGNIDTAGPGGVRKRVKKPTSTKPLTNTINDEPTSSSKVKPKPAYKKPEPKVFTPAPSPQSFVFRPKSTPFTFQPRPSPVAAPNPKPMPPKKSIINAPVTKINSIEDNNIKIKNGPSKTGSARIKRPEPTSLPPPVAIDFAPNNEGDISLEHVIKPTAPPTKLGSKLEPEGIVVGNNTRIPVGNIAPSPPDLYVDEPKTDADPENARAPPSCKLSSAIVVFSLASTVLLAVGT